MSTTATDRLRRAGDSDPLETLARVGFAGYGVIHLLVGWLALQIAWRGSAGPSADPAGAFRTLSRQPFGEVLLWSLALGLLALAVWQATDAIWGHAHRQTGERIRKRAINGARTVVYAVLAYGAASVAAGTGSSGSQSQQQATAGVLAMPGGEAMVVVAGLLVIAVGAGHVHKGATQSFLDDLDTASMSHSGREGARRLGVAGYVAKGLALALVGALLAYAAVTHEEGKVGLDGALHTLAGEPYGKFLITLVAAGFVAFGLFAVLKARHRMM